MQTKMQHTKHRFGLVGKNISYSFSKGYFTDKFLDMGLEGYSYENFDLQRIDEFPELLKSHPDVKGLNVTIPYKQEVLPYLDALDAQAKEIGAVNTIKFDGKRLIGHNTDAYGFQKSIESFLKPHHTKALIFGTGGGVEGHCLCSWPTWHRCYLCIQKSRYDSNRIWRFKPIGVRKSTHFGQLYAFGHTSKCLSL